jgi:triacylglycerol lipase
MRKPIIAAACAAAVLLSAGIGKADITRLPPDVVMGIAALGPTLDRPMVLKTNELMKGLAPMTPPASVTVTKDVAYGEDPLQQLDIYQPARARGLPIAVYIHGAGYVGGDKKDYDNIGTYLSQHGIVVFNANYRLAPKVTWPAESQDVGAVVAFIKKNAARYGGDPKRIVLIGSSAGANLIATYVLDKRIYPKAGPGVAAAVLISLPGSRPSGVRQQDQVYFGDPSVIPSRVPGPFLEQSKIPLMIVTAEYDPIFLAPEAYDFAGRLCVRDGKCPAFVYLKGHNHISENASIGSPDDQLAQPLAEFVRAAH